MLHLLALSTIVLASSVTLTVESNDTSLTGKGINSLPFGPGKNGVVLTDSPLIYNYNPSDGTVFEEISINDGPLPFVFGQLGDQLIAQSNGIEIPVNATEGYLSINGSTSVFYACNQLDWDPFHYSSAKDKGVAIYDFSVSVPKGCESIKIKATEFHLS